MPKNKNKNRKEEQLRPQNHRISTHIIDYDDIKQQRCRHLPRCKANY